MDSNQNTMDMYQVRAIYGMFKIISVISIVAPNKALLRKIYSLVFLNFRRARR